MFTEEKTTMFKYKKIAENRKRMGLSQEKLSELIGVSRQAIQKWESGATVPDFAHIVSMADIFGITADSFANDTAECAGVINDSPDFPSWGGWESYSKMLPIERMFRAFFTGFSYNTGHS